MNLFIPAINLMSLYTSYSSSSSSSIVTDVVSVVNLLRSPVLNYRQFKAFLDEIESVSFNPSGSNQF
jgi:hypothetical protein